METVAHTPTESKNNAVASEHTPLDASDGKATDATGESAGVPIARNGHGAPRAAWRETHKITRWLHTYLSMISLLLVLFFGATGVTLNHPSWTFGLDGSQQTLSGTLPAGFETNGAVDFLAVSQYMQKMHKVRGDATDYTADATQGSMSFKGPGYAADLFFDVDTGAYDLTVDQQGLLAVMNDLHKGRNTAGSWNWTIDVAGGLLVAVAVTGLGLQFFLKRRRARAYVVAGVGTLISLILIVVTVN